MRISDLVEQFLRWNSRHRSPATVGFYRTRLKKFRDAYNAHDLATLTPVYERDPRAVRARLFHHNSHSYASMVMGLCHFRHCGLVAVAARRRPRLSTRLAIHFLHLVQDR